MKPCDVIVIGGGPAGATAAIFLHRQGHSVVLLDRARFPRDKVCGEFVSPAADSIFEELGILSELENHSALRLKGVMISSYEKEEVWVGYPPKPGELKAPASLSLPRLVLDHVLIQRVKKMGIDFRENHQVDDLIFENGNVTGVKGRDESNTPFSIKARIIVDAGGRNGISLRRLGLKRDNKDQSKVALAAHWAGAKQIQDYCYMHVSPPGYTGMARVGLDSVNVVLVVDTRRLKGVDLKNFYLETVLKNKCRRELLDGADLMESPRTIESLAFSVRPPSCGGLLLAGDASGFIDPFTGEGIYLALKSAQLATETICQALEFSNVSHEFLRRYEVLKESEFGAKFRLSQLLQYLIYSPKLCSQVVRVLSANPRLAGQLVGVIGDYLPARQVMSVSFLIKFLKGIVIPESEFDHGASSLPIPENLA